MLRQDEFWRYFPEREREREEEEVLQGGNYSIGLLLQQISGLSDHFWLKWKTWGKSLDDPQRRYQLCYA